MRPSCAVMRSFNVSECPRVIGFDNGFLSDSLKQKISLATTKVTEMGGPTFP